MNKIKRLLTIFRPPREWRFIVTVLLGIFTGLLLFILHAARATSYLSDDPKACVNCHVMAPQFATWERGSHGKVTNCNDCHVPQDNFINKYFFKASDGLRHSFMFTFRLEPQVIQIKHAGKKAVQQNCIRCHSNVIHPISLRAISAKSIIQEEERYCWDCHRETPHGRVNSLSSTPYARVPVSSPIIPDWITNTISKTKN
jgi:cytochrome c nitrite reductase small subunit